MRMRAARLNGVLLVLAGLLVPAAGVAGAQEPTLVAAVPGQQAAVGTDGDYVVWWTASVPFDPDTQRVFVGHLADPQVAPVAPLRPDSYNQTSPSVEDDLVIWEENTRHNSSDIWAKDLRTGQITAVAATPAHETLPFIAGGWVLWSQYAVNDMNATLMARDVRGGGEPVRVADLNSGVDVAAVQRVSNQFRWAETKLFPKGGGVGWTVYQAAPGPPVLLAQGAPHQFAAYFALAGDVLVYASTYTDGVWAVDLPHGEPQALAGGQDMAIAPGVATDGRLVIWAEQPTDPANPSRIDRANLVGYDLVTGTRFPITTDAAGDAYPAIGGGMLVWVRGDERTRTLHATSLAPLLARLPPTDTDERRYFPETGHTLTGGFKGYWERHGGLPIFGFPQTQEYRAVNPSDRRTYTVQYFERQRFEYHPEQQGTPYEVELGRLGAEQAARRADLQGLWAFNPVAAEAEHPPGCRYLAATGHRLCGEFRPYWEGNGLDLGDDGVSFRESLALFGYPISEEFIDPAIGLITQYFERAVFEYHAGLPAGQRVLLRRLGAECRYGCGP